jgi:type VI protein secretion system component Hcp
MEKTMSKNTMHNSEASLEVHEFKDELSEEELKNVFGGKATFHDLSFMHQLDKASPVLMQPV